MRKVLAGLFWALAATCMADPSAEVRGLWVVRTGLVSPAAVDQVDGLTPDAAAHLQQRDDHRALVGAVGHRLPVVAAHVAGAFGLDGMYVGVPVIIGAGGVERLVEIQMDANEQAMFQKSVDAVKGLVAACKQIDPSLA